MSKEITIVSGDDWQGLYVDGKLVDEGHSIQLDTFARIMGIDLNEKEADFDWLEKEGRMPDNLSEVKFAK